MSSIYVKNGVLKNKLGIMDSSELVAKENHYFLLELNRLKQNKYFELSSEYVQNLHYILFNRIYKWAGQYRKENIMRRESILDGKSIRYNNYLNIGQDIDDLLRETRMVIPKLNDDERLKLITEVVMNLWLIHPFRNGNTRFVIAFIQQYLVSNNQNFDIRLLFNNSRYFRSLLVESINEAEELGVASNSDKVLHLIRRGISK